MPRLTETLKGRLLQELVMDPDWRSAGKRAGLTPTQISHLKQDKKFMALAERKIEKALSDTMDASGAVKRFQKTQQKLEKALDEGDLSVASNLIRSHEMEFRMHGLFEKDNQQKAAPMQININLGDDPMKVVVEQEDE